MALSAPLWLLGAATGIQLLPGLPISALMAFCPATAAVILLIRQDGRPAASAFLRALLDWTGIRRRRALAPALLVMPLIALMAYAVMRVSGRPLPAFTVSWIGVPVLAVGFLVAALGEELGWSGYLLDPVQRRVGPLAAGLLIGTMWALWHVVPFIEVARPPDWIFWQCLNQVATRVFLVWLYHHSGRSVPVVAVCHAMSNVSWQLFPEQGSHYDPRVFALLTAGVTAFVLLRDRQAFGPAATDRPDPA